MSSPRRAGRNAATASSERGASGAIGVSSVIISLLFVAPSWHQRRRWPQAGLRPVSEALGLEVPYGFDLDQHRSGGHEVRQIGPADRSREAPDDRLEEPGGFRPAG